VARRLSLDVSYAIPPSRIFGITWRRNGAAVNVNTRDSKLEDPELRARLARVFERGLSQGGRLCLPVEKSTTSWISEHWKTRSGQLYLLPGDSAIGFRLPLTSLPYVPPEARTFVPPPDPFAPLPPMVPRDKKRPRLHKWTWR